MTIALSPVVPESVLIGLGLLTALMAAYGLWRGARGVWLRLIPATALLLAIADPRLLHEERAPLNDVAVIAVDDSPSQSIGQRPARTAAAAAALGEQLARQPNLEVRTVRLGRGPRGDGTRLFGPLASAMADIPASRLAGVIVLSDGQVHDVPAAAPFNAPLHVLLTGERDERDRRIRIERAPDYGLVGEQALLRVVADQAGEPDGTVLPVTVRQNGRPIRRLALDSGAPADIAVTLDVPGANVFEVEVEAGGTELSMANNRALVSINGIRDRLRVLLISGEPHVGERAWRNLLKSDPNVDLVHFTILRPVTKDDGTPLSELALIAFPIRELFEEQLYNFDLVIFDRYSRKGLVPYQFMANVAAYVRNGGAMMLAVGPEFADSSSLYDSPLQSILPAAPTGTVFSQAFTPALSELGRRHPVTADLTGAAGRGDRPAWGRWLRNVQVTQSSGQRVMDGANGEPLLILDHVDKGRVALLLSDTLWLWGKGVDGGGPQTEFMRRIAHWLMKEPQLEEEALSGEVKDDQLIVSRRSLDPAPRPVTVERPDGSRETVTPRDDGEGRATAVVEVSTPGLYRLSDGEIGAVAAVGTSDPLETHDVLSTESKVRPLVEATDGGVYWLAETGTPALRRVATGRAAHGGTWLGLRSNEQFVITGVSETTLLPVALVLLLSLGGAMMAWWREGR